MSSKRCRESMKLEVAECLEHALSQLRSIWDEIGICEEQRIERQSVVLHHIRNLLSEMVTEENELRKRLMGSVANCSQDVVKLSQELAISTFEPPARLTILQLEKLLRQKVEVLSKEKHERLVNVKKLKDREQNLCDLLCTTPYYIPSGTVPTEEQLTALQDHIQSLTDEKEARENILATTKKEIVKLMEFLEQDPNTSFEREVVCEEDDSFLLSKENMQLLKSLHQELEFKDIENQGTADLLRDQISSLWKRLLYPKEEMDVYLAGHAGHKPSDIKVLRDEMARLEELKKQNLKRVTEAIRDEISVWWDKCYFSRKQRNEFAPFYDDEFTEELLLQHDEQFAMVKAYYEANKSILECVHKREIMWKKMLEFEKKAIDPNRFNNRGGNLLLEEKERKKINRDLPKLEKLLSEQIRVFEQEKGSPFLVDGCRFMDYVKIQWAAHEQSKKVQKEEREKAKHQQTENEMNFGSRPNTPAKRRFNTTSKTPTKRQKGMNGSSYAPSPRLGVTHSSIMPSPSPVRRPPRACRGTPSSNAKKTPGRCGVASSTSPYIPHVPFPSPGSKCYPPKCAVRKTETPLRNLRPVPQRVSHRRALAERNADMSHAFSVSTVSGGLTAGTINSTVASNCASYTDFARDLEGNNRNNCRSSAVTSPTNLTSSRAHLTLI